MNKIYLGDSVYADFDGFAITLTTENGYGPTNTIHMEPEVVEAFRLYVRHLRKRTQEEVPHHREPADAGGDAGNVASTGGVGTDPASSPDPGRQERINELENSFGQGPLRDGQLQSEI